MRNNRPRFGRGTALAFLAGMALMVAASGPASADTDADACMMIYTTPIEEWDREAMIEACQAAVERAPNSPDLLYVLGSLVRDREEQKALFHRAANAGHAEAAGAFAMMSDDAETRRVWLRRAVRLGSGGAAYEFSRLYSPDEKHGIPADHPKDAKLSLSWLFTSAEMGYALAQYYLAEAYLDGKGVRQDDRTAFTWFNRAAAQSPTLARMAKRRVESYRMVQQLRQPKVNQDVLIGAVIIGLGALAVLGADGSDDGSSAASSPTGGASKPTAEPWILHPDPALDQTLMDGWMMD